jgi:hypothetical protein
MDKVSLYVNLISRVYIQHVGGKSELSETIERTLFLVQEREQKSERFDFFSRRDFVSCYDTFSKETNPISISVQFNV